MGYCYLINDTQDLGSVPMDCWNIKRNFNIWWRSIWFWSGKILSPHKNETVGVSTSNASAEERARKVWDETMKFSSNILTPFHFSIVLLPPNVKTAVPIYSNLIIFWTNRTIIIKFSFSMKWHKKNAQFVVSNLLLAEQEIPSTYLIFMRSPGYLGGCWKRLRFRMRTYFI